MLGENELELIKSLADEVGFGGCRRGVEVMPVGERGRKDARLRDKDHVKSKGKEPKKELVSAQTF